MSALTRLVTDVVGVVLASAVLLLMAEDPGVAAVLSKFPPADGRSHPPDWRALLSGVVAVGGLFVTTPRPARGADLV